jgi:membrane protein YqaA with SNARE-associated domain
MKIFSPLYDRVLRWSEHPHAHYYLSAMSFIESIFWPIPVDVMLAPMALSRPAKAWQFAALATFFSVSGAVFGYLLGLFFFDTLAAPMIEAAGYQHKFDIAVEWFREQGVWVIFIAGFTPIPYKVFTISAGLLSMAFIPFILASLVGRGLRFFLVAALMKWGGARMERQLRRFIDVIGWVTIGLAIALYLYLR